MGGAGGPGPKAATGAADASPGTATTEASSPAAAATADNKPLWYLDAQGKIAVRLVRVGSSDGINTEIIGADDLEGKQVILREKAE